MGQQISRVGQNWQSVAGKMYAKRALGDMATIENVIEQLDTQIRLLQRVQNYYARCEEEIGAAVRRLPT